jgi:hypothetical protein
MKTAMARARSVFGKMSPSSDVDAGEHVASPTPTRRRTENNCQKFRAAPESAVNTLQTKTPPARILRRSTLSVSRPNGRPTTA